MEYAATNPVALYCSMVAAGQRLLLFIIPGKQETRFLIKRKALKNRALFCG